MEVYAENLVKDENGIYGIDSFKYAKYFSEHLIDYFTFTNEEGEEIKQYDSITFDEFTNVYSKKNQDFDELGFMNKILGSEKLSELQTTLANERKRVCMFNMCYLSLYILEKAKLRYLVLLRPTIKDTLTELKKIKKVTFINEDGSKAESSSKILADTLIEAMESKDECTHYEVEKLVTWNEVADNRLMQSLFVYDLSVFLNDYFKAKRKKNALVSTTEQELIRYLMYFFGLTPVIVTDSRYRQLMMYYKKIVMQNRNINRINIDGKPRYIKFDFIDYQTWKSGKIDWTKHLTFEIKPGDTIQFQPRNRQFFAAPITNDFLFQYPDYSLYFCAR